MVMCRNEVTNELNWKAYRATSRSEYGQTRHIKCWAIPWTTDLFLDIQDTHTQASFFQSLAVHKLFRLDHLNMKFLTLFALAASATAAAVEKRGGEWNTWAPVTVYVTTTEVEWQTTTVWKPTYTTVTETCYETEWSTTTAVCWIQSVL